MHPPHPERRAPGPLSARRSPLPVLQRWWFWVGLIGLLWAFPLWKSLRADLPARLPGEDGPALDLSLPDDHGGTFHLADLRGRCVVLTALPLAEERARDETWEALVYAILAHGGGADELRGWLEEHRAPRPELHFAIDEGRVEMSRLCAQAGAASADFLLLDRHGRIRGAYGREPEEVERLVLHAGQLANWPGQDGER